MATYRLSGVQGSLRKAGQQVETRGTATDPPWPTGCDQREPFLPSLQIPEWPCSKSSTAQGSGY